MSWLESHQALRTHWKTKRLKRLLDLDNYQTIGLLHCLWWWALDAAPEGDLSRFTPEDIADALDWERTEDAPALIQALKEAQFIDDNMKLHNWRRYAGKLIERRRADVERKRNSTNPPAELRRNSGGTPTASGVTLTVPVPIPLPEPVTNPAPAAVEEVQEERIAAFAADSSSISVPLPTLSDAARETLNVWRAAHGKRSPPKLRPALAAKLERAQQELGDTWLHPAMVWSGERDIPELDKAINAAYTARKNSETGAGNAATGRRPDSPRQWPGGPAIGTRPGSPSPANSFAQYEQRDEPDR